MSHATPDPEVLSQAADWFALLRSGDASSEDTRRWRHWLAQHPAHRQGWALVERIQQQFEAATGDHPAQADATLSRARDNRLRRRSLLKGLALMLGAGGLGWAGWRTDAVQQRRAVWSAPYRTGVGEIRAWTLADGGRLWLNTDSAVDGVEADGPVRPLRLLRGEMLLETGGPVRVDTPAGSLRPLGTRFTVRLDEHHTLVAVHEGRVEIVTAEGRRRVIPAGRQTRFSDHAIDPPRPVETTREAWHRGVLAADDIRLADLLAELARYRHGYLNVSPAVADLRVFGGFPLTDTDQALAMLEAVLPIQVTHPLPGWTEVRRRAPEK